MGDVKPVIAVTGTHREAAALAKLGITVISAGGDSARLYRELESRALGAQGIISFGMAGALVSAMKNGDWVIGTGLTGTWTGTCDASMSDFLSQCMPSAHLGVFYADGRLIGEPFEKFQLGQTTGAVAVDMESHVAAQFAAENDIPFAIIRCISDEATTALPPAISVAMRSGGSLSVGAVLKSIFQRPSQLPELIHCARRFRAAFAGMVGDVGKLEPLLRLGTADATTFRADGRPFPR